MSISVSSEDQDAAVRQQALSDAAGFLRRVIGEFETGLARLYAERPLPAGRIGETLEISRRSDAHFLQVFRQIADAIERDDLGGQVG